MESYKNLSEEDTRDMYITPALQKKWDKETQIRREVYFTAGKVVVRGSVSTRQKGKKADYILYYNSSKPIAVVEAKKYDLEVGTGMQQAIDYAEILDLPFAYSTNGKAFLEHDMLTGNEREISIDDFPSPEDLWHRYKVAKHITPTQEEIIDVPYYYAPGTNKPRYYQTIAINRTCEAIAKGEHRILLVMATGTGKTYTAFQIIHRLRQSGLKRKILYLADRNMLIDQTMAQDFQPFTKIMTKIENRKMDSSFEIYMALYQQLTDGQNLDIFKQFSEDFFDLIIVDECHRGSAADDSNWKRILEYYKSATQIGLTATPKETTEVSNIQYFGNPIYTYSLKQGIDDGFLAPYKVIRVNLDKDIAGYRPEIGKKDVYGEDIILKDDEIFYQSDMDKKIIIDERTEAVAKRITEFLKKSDRFNKTIVFCIDIEHAERMRQALVRENNDLVAENSKYIMRITGDNQEGKNQLENFIDVEEKYPTIVTTSKLLTTGADCKTCKLIVLDSNINSMTEFKQIIGRGTRIREDYQKMYFTIMDFRNASRLFSDPNFDGEPISIKDVNPDGEMPSDNDDTSIGTDDTNSKDILIDKPIIPDIEKEPPRGKIHVNGVDVNIYNEIVSYYDKDGKLVTESLRDFSKRSILNEFASLDDFINKWNSADKKQAILDELKEQGVLLDELRKDVGTDEIGDFDLILHIAYDKKPLTRYERVNKVIKKGYLYKYSEVAQNILKDLLEKYSDNNELDLTDTKILELRPLNEYGSPMEIVDAFGGKDNYIKAVEELENELYAS